MNDKNSDELYRLAKPYGTQHFISLCSSEESTETVFPELFTPPFSAFGAVIEFLVM